MEEAELINKAKKGDTRALALLYQQNHGLLLKYLIKITINIHLAEDLAQDTMLKCIEKIHLYNGKAKFSSWLIAIATNLYIDGLRKKKREQGWKEKEQDQAVRQLRWQVDQSNNGCDEILDVLAELHEDVRIPIILKHYYGYSYEEISKIMGIALGTVKSRIHNGLANLRKGMEVNE